nr:LysR family transcriptional regulator [Streptomyces sp. NBC_00830]WTB35829.1 LysR family transcriptional regulator [Streptomyces sp. NBC_00830]
MELRQMEVVVTVAEEGGFSAAARRLHVVQSAVSATVRALERELGTQLFQRTTHRVSLTSAGEAFLPAARATLQAAEDARTAVDLVMEEMCGDITVGVMQGLYTGLSQALADFHREHPKVTVRLRQAPVAAMPQTLRDGIVDLAVVALDTPELRGLTTRLLAHEDMVLVTAPTSPLPPHRPVTLAEAARLPLVDFPPDWAIRHEVDNAFRAAGLERTTTFEVNDVLAATDLVRHGLGVCIMPPLLAARFPELPVRSFTANAPAWTVRVVYPHGQLTPAVAALLRRIR